MHTLYERAEPIPTLYVKSLSSFAGPEYSVNQIFQLARRTAPCYRESRVACPRSSSARANPFKWSSKIWTPLLATMSARTSSTPWTG